MLEEQNILLSEGLNYLERVLPEEERTEKTSKKEGCVFSVVNKRKGW